MLPSDSTPKTPWCYLCWALYQFCPHPLFEVFMIRVPVYLLLKSGFTYFAAFPLGRWLAMHGIGGWAAPGGSLAFEAGAGTWPWAGGHQSSPLAACHASRAPSVPWPMGVCRRPGRMGLAGRLHLSPLLKLLKATSKTAYVTSKTALDYGL
jgi:hypothetical protein